MLCSKIDYEWIVVDDKQEPLAYKKPGEDPVFIDSEKAVLQCIETMNAMNRAHKNSQNLLADLSRHL
jgi:hypothetical protein